MKQEYFRTFLFMIISFYALTLNLYPQDSLLIETNNYSLFFIGESQSISELKSKFIAGCTFVNIPIDPNFYKQEYPNPFSPSVYKQKFIYRISNNSNIQINIIDTKDSILFSLNYNDQNEGYYYFIIKSKCLDKYRIFDKLNNSFENYRIKFVINCEEYIIPFSNFVYKKE